jgi:hypothetical protein
VAASGFILCAVIATVAGFREPPKQRLGDWTVLAYGLWAVLGLVAVAGFYRNRWWAYILECAFLWMAIIGSYLYPSASKAEWPKVGSSNWFSKIGFVICTLYLLYLGYERYIEERKNASKR